MFGRFVFLLLSVVFSVNNMRILIGILLCFLLSNNHSHKVFVHLKIVLIKFKKCSVNLSNCSGNKN